MPHTKQAKIKNHKLYEGNVWKTILKVSTPIILFALVMSFYGIIDSLMAANLVEWVDPNTGKIYNPSSVLGILTPYAGLFFGFMTIFLVGQALIYAKEYGQQNYDAASAALNQSILATIVLGLFFVGLSFLTSEHYIKGVLELGGHHLPKEAIRDSANYLSLIIVAVIIIQVQQSFLRSLRVEGKGYVALIIPTFSIGINIGFNYLFMGVLETGFVGAAYASIIAPAFGLFTTIIYVVIMKARNEITMTFTLKGFRPNKKLIWLMVIFGITSVVRRTAYAYGNMIFSVYVSWVGVPEWKSFLTVGIQISGFLNFFALGVGQAIGMLIAYYWGVGDKEKLKQTAVAGIIYTFLLQIIFASILLSINTYLFNWYNIVPPNNNMPIFTAAFSLLTIGMILQAPVILGPFIFASMKRIKEGMLYVLIMMIILTLTPTIIFFSVQGKEENILWIIASYPISSMLTCFFTAPILLTWYRKLSI